MIRKKQILFLIFIMAAVLLTSCGQKEDAGSLAVDENISASLTYDHRMQLDYAKEFAVDYYNDGLALITISDGSRFLVVPQKEEAPDRSRFRYHGVKTAGRSHLSCGICNDGHVPVARCARCDQPFRDKKRRMVY